MPEQLFAPLDQFGGREFRVGVLPWSHHVLGTRKPGPGPATYHQYWGYEIDLLQSIAARHNEPALT